MGRKLWEMGIEGLDGVSGGKGKPTPIGPSGSRSFVMEGVTYADTPKNPKILSDVAWVKVAESCLQGRPSAAAWWVSGEPRMFQFLISEMSKDGHSIGGAFW